MDVSKYNYNEDVLEDIILTSVWDIGKRVNNKSFFE
jgi:hypothetical protein